MSKLTRCERRQMVSHFLCQQSVFYAPFWSFLVEGFYCNHGYEDLFTLIKQQILIQIIVCP